MLAASRDAGWVTDVTYYRRSFTRSFGVFRIPELIAVLPSCVAGNIRTRAVLDVETKRGYWLTVHAQDHGVVPLSSSLQVSFNDRAWRRFIDDSFVDEHEPLNRAALSRVNRKRIIASINSSLFIVEPLSLEPVVHP